jgi:hypothetical protein
MTAASRYGRLSFLGKLGVIVLVTLVLLESLLFYLQTRHGFRHVILPLVAKLAGGRLQVRDGHLSLLGTLKVDGVVYEDPAAEISFDAERVVLRATPWSFVMEDVPRIVDLEVKKANLRVVVRSGPTAEPTKETDGEQAVKLPLLPVAVERARLEDVTATVEQGDRRITGQIAAALNQLGPGRAGNVTLRAGFLVERKGRPDLSGTIDLSLPVEVGSEGTPIKWNGSNRVRIRTGGGSLEPTDPEVVSFEQTLTGEYEQAARSLRVASQVAISRAGTQQGIVVLTAAMDHAKRPTEIDASLTLAGIQGDMLNLWLREAEATHVHAGRFDAKLEAHVEGARTSVQAKVTGSGVRLRLGNREASPPVDVSLQHVGSFDSATKDVTIKTLTLAMGDGVKTILSGALDHPVSLDLDRLEGGTPSAGTVGEPAVWSLRLTPSKIQELRPWFALLGRNPLQGVEAGRLGGGLVVSVYEQGAIVDVAARFEGTEVMIRGEGSGMASVIGPLGIVADWRSRLTDMQQLKLDPATSTVSLKGKQVAALYATGALWLGNAPGLTGLDGKLKLTGLPGETLNPLLGLWSEIRIGRAQIDGHADIVVDESHARWEVDLRSQDLHIQMSGRPHDAPPLDLQIKQTGKLDRTAQWLRLDQLNVQVVERQRPVVTVSLDQPLTLDLARGQKGDASNTGASSKPITLGLRINRLGLHRFRPWVALVGSQALTPVRGGVLDADLRVRLIGADDVVVVGRLDLEQVTFERGAKLLSKPVTFGTEIRASVADRSRVTVDSWAVRAVDGSRLLAQARLTGSADSGGATDLLLDVAAGDLSEFVDRLGLMTERQRGIISGGNLKGEVRVITAGPAKPLTVKSGLRSANLNISLDRTHQLTRTIDVQADVEIDGGRTMVDIRRVEVEVESAGAKAGTLMASGQWPLPAEDTTTLAGAVNVVVKEWDNGPLVDFFGILPGRASNPLPLTGELKVVQKAGGKMLAIQGRETIGPITVAVKGRAAPETAIVHLEHYVEQGDDEIQVTALSLTSERSKGQADRVTMSGKVRMGPGPSLRLHGSVDALDTDWYAALMALPGGQTPEEKAPAGKQPAVKDEGNGFVVPLNLDIDLVIGSVTYRTFEIAKGRLIAKGDGQKMQATLEPTGVAGGSVQGTVTVAQKGEQPEFGWNIKGDALDFGIITKAASTGQEPEFTGRGKFSTAGTGRGQGEALRQSLNGTVVFDVADGQFVKAPALEFLAEQTQIDHFRDLGFDTLRGELRIKNGWVHLNQPRAVGPSIEAEAVGKIGLDGRIDTRVHPKIGPAFSEQVKIPCLDRFAKTADGFIELPIAVAIKGTVEHPEYKMETTGTAGHNAGSLVGTIANVLSGCRGGEAAQKKTEKTVDVIKDKAADVKQDLFGGKKKR